MPKNRIVSFRTTPVQRRRLGRYARTAFRKAGVRVNTKKRDHVSLFLGNLTDAILDGKVRVDPRRFLIAA